MLMNSFILMRMKGWYQMAKITLKDLSHSYLKTQSSDADWAVRDAVSYTHLTLPTISDV